MSYKGTMSCVYQCLSFQTYIRLIRLNSDVDFELRDWFQKFRRTKFRRILMKFRRAVGKE